MYIYMPYIFHPSPADEAIRHKLTIYHVFSNCNQGLLIHLFAIAAFKK